MATLKETGRFKALLTNYTKNRQAFKCDMEIKTCKNGRPGASNTLDDNKCYLFTMTPRFETTTAPSPRSVTFGQGPSPFEACAAAHQTSESFGAYTVAHPSSTRQERREAIAKAVRHNHTPAAVDGLKSNLINGSNPPSSSSSASSFSSAPTVSHMQSASYSEAMAAHQQGLQCSKKMRCERVKGFFDAVHVAQQPPPPKIVAAPAAAAAAAAAAATAMPLNLGRDTAEPAEPVELISRTQAGFSYGAAAQAAAKSGKPMGRAERREAMQRFLASKRQVTSGVVSASGGGAAHSRLL